MMQGGIAQFERYAGALTPQQRAAVDTWLPRLKPGRHRRRRRRRRRRRGADGHRRRDRRRDAHQQTTAGSLISFYAAGIGVMFLLFSLVGGAGGALLDEVETGTLERLLSTRIGMTGLLAGKWMLLDADRLLQLTRDVPVGRGSRSGCRCSRICPASS